MNLYFLIFFDCYYFKKSIKTRNPKIKKLKRLIEANPETDKINIFKFDSFAKINYKQEF